MHRQGMQTPLLKDFSYSCTRSYSKKLVHVPDTPVQGGPNKKIFLLSFPILLLTLVLHNSTCICSRDSNWHFRKKRFESVPCLFSRWPLHLNVSEFWWYQVLVLEPLNHILRDEWLTKLSFPWIFILHCSFYKRPGSRRKRQKPRYTQPANTSRTCIQADQVPGTVRVPGTWYSPGTTLFTTLLRTIVHFTSSVLLTQRIYYSTPVVPVVSRKYRSRWSLNRNQPTGTNFPRLLTGTRYLVRYQITRVL